MSESSQTIAPAEEEPAAGANVTVSGWGMSEVR